MDFTQWWPPASLQPPPPPHLAIDHSYNPYSLYPLRPSPPAHYPSPYPNDYAPHAGFAVGLVAGAGAGANVGSVRGLAPCYYGRIGPDPVGYGQIPPRAFGGSDPVAPSRAAPPQRGSKPSNKKGSKPTKAVQSAYCGACKIECTTQEVLSAHKQGKKHKKKLHKLQESITPKPPHVPQPATNPVEKKERKKRKDGPGEDLETKKRKVLEGGVQPDEVKVCAICNVVANSQKVFDSHIAGWKHADNVKKQKEAAVAS